MDAVISQRATPTHAGLRSLRAVFGDPGLRIPLTYFVVAQLLDIITTLMGIVFGLNELNPVTAGVLSRFGGFGLLVQKLPTVMFVAVAASVLPRRTAILAAWAFTILMAGVVASNVALIVAVHHR
jgi:uncharacterized protein DUF5658